MPGREHLLALCLGQQRQVCQTLSRVGDHACEQGLEMAKHPRHRRAIKAGALVAQAQHQGWPWGDQHGERIVRPWDKAHLLDLQAARPFRDSGMPWIVLKHQEGIK